MPKFRINAVNSKTRERALPTSTEIRKPDSDSFIPYNKKGKKNTPPQTPQKVTPQLTEPSPPSKKSPNKKGKNTSQTPQGVDQSTKPSAPSAEESPKLHQQLEEINKLLKELVPKNASSEKVPQGNESNASALSHATSVALDATLGYIWYFSGAFKKSPFKEDGTDYQLMVQQALYLAAVLRSAYQVTSAIAKIPAVQKAYNNLVSILQETINKQTKK